jgi:hypothetical protein
MKKNKAMSRRVGIEIEVFPKLTINIAPIRTGLRVKKSKTTAIKKVEVAVSKVKVNLLFNI